ncbi:polyketide cyclase [Chryseobacterium sp.]|uniref:polyketide cyclase n=1 Tax=Chryseobacterium sp. TaxID=1871047 RepID=UPI0011CC0AEF|nr:polyketide cyclase [Chryseobacterium sp.]TXF79060.1 polyketide cyclase [Chryseobacterium sp.]
MRWIKYWVIGIILLLGIYAASMYFFVEESKSFRVEKEINYPVEKVFPQFNSLQNFYRWNSYFSSSKTMHADFYSPYEGQGSAMSFRDAKTGKTGEMFIRYQNLNRTLKYELFEDNKGNPTLINLKFTKVSPTRTKVIWFVHTPKQGLLSRSLNLFSEDSFVEDLDGSLAGLGNILANKVDRDNRVANIKYDTLMVEQQEGQLLLGVNVSTKNGKDALLRNIALNHNKVYNYMTTDLAKREDEIGLPVLVTAAGNFKDKEISYFYGIPVSKRQSVSDNNFSFRTINTSQNYVMYFKGNFEARIGAIQQLLLKAKKDTMRNGELLETFIEPPVSGEEVNMKISLPVYR